MVASRGMSTDEAKDRGRPETATPSLRRRRSRTRGADSGAMTRSRSRARSVGQLNESDSCSLFMRTIDDLAPSSSENKSVDSTAAVDTASSAVPLPRLAAPSSPAGTPDTGLDLRSRVSSAASRDNPPGVPAASDSKQAAGDLIDRPLTKVGAFG